jgi:hypothetical protein
LRLLLPPCSPPLVRGDGDSREVNFITTHLGLLYILGRLTEEIFKGYELNMCRQAFIDHSGVTYLIKKKEYMSLLFAFITTKLF